MYLALNIRIFNGTGTDIVLTYLNYSVWVWIVLHTPEIHVLQSFLKNVYSVHVWVGGCLVCYAVSLVYPLLFRPGH